MHFTNSPIPTMQRRGGSAQGLWDVKMEYAGLYIPKTLGNALLSVQKSRRQLTNTVIRTAASVTEVLLCCVDVFNRKQDFSPLRDHYPT